MKKLLTAILIVIAASLAIVGIAFACHNSLSVQSNACETVQAQGTYFGNSHKWNKVELYLDGVLKASNEGNQSSVSTSFNVATSPGNHTVMVKGYEWTRFGFLDWRWKLMDTDSKSITVKSCYTACDELGTPVYDYGPWSAWTPDDANQQFTRTRDFTVTTPDAYDAEHVCAFVEDTEIETKPYGTSSVGVVPMLSLVGLSGLIATVVVMVTTTTSG